LITSANSNSPQGGGQQSEELQKDQYSFNNDSLPAEEPAARESNEPKTKVCRKCSVQSLTEGGYCPSCGTPYLARRRFANVNKRLVVTAAAVAIAVIAGIGITLNVQHTNQVNVEQAAAASAAEAENRRQTEATRASEAAATAKQVADAAKRSQRKLIVTSLEESIQKDAESRVAKGVLVGPITRASCTPLGGGSSDDLTAITGTFQCIAVNKTEADGSSSGYRFSATVNWNDASYSWHLGS
jgi:ribosomal protein L37E